MNLMSEHTELLTEQRLGSFRGHLASKGFRGFGSFNRSFGLGV